MFVHKFFKSQVLRKSKMSSIQQNSIEDKALLIEKEILKDTNARGDLNKLARRGDLKKIISHLRSLKNSSMEEKCLLLTGFPCIKASKSVEDLVSDNRINGAKNVQETDGIAGAIAIARALGPNKCIIGIEGDDDVNCKNCEDSASFAVKRALEDLGEETSSFLPYQRIDPDNTFRIFSIPTVRKLQKQKQVILFKQDILEKLGKYSILAIEKAGYALTTNDQEDSISSGKTASGNSVECSRAYTMKGRDITLDCAPAGFMKCLWDNASLRMAIGDGGNELGLGTVNDLTRQHIPLGNKIACMSEFSADYLLISGVSNWGGYAVALGLLYMEHDKEQSKYKDVICENSERVIANTLKNLGVCDGVTGKFEHGTVDGISFDRHMILLKKLQEILL